MEGREEGFLGDVSVCVALCVRRRKKMNYRKGVTMKKWMKRGKWAFVLLAAASHVGLNWHKM